MAIKPVPLIFLELSEKKTHLEKVKYLNENRNDMADLLLELSFSKKIRITLPEGAPNYQKTGEAALYNAHMLYANRRQIEMFINDNTSHIPEIRRESLFIDLLENLDPAEAELLIQVKDKKLTSYPGITRSVIEKVYDFELIDEPKTEEPVPVVEEKVEEPTVEVPVDVAPEPEKKPVAKKPATRRKPAAKKSTPRKRKAPTKTESSSS